MDSSQVKIDIIRGRRILVIDDHRNIRVSLKMTLEGEGAQVFEADCVKDGTEKLGHLGKDAGSFQYDCVLLDIRMPDGSGLDILNRLSEFDLASRVIMISGEGTISEAFEATQMGAFDYIEKPFGEERIIVSVARCLSFNKVSTDKRTLEKKLNQDHEMLGDHPAIQSVLKMAKKVAPTNSRVLIHGESGTGKELLAKFVHKESSRSDKTNIKVNCAAIPPNLIESELFGHEKGAFTGATKQRKGVFERADKGTLFLDEIGELPLDCQSKLLRALQNGEIQRVGGDATIKVDVRLVAATNRDLQEMVDNGEFREDLYYRLNVITLTLPPLRERQSDIATIAKSFLHVACDEHSLGEKQFSDQALAQLTSYNWPGNIRELKNVVERSAILADHVIIDDIDELSAIPSSATEPTASPDSEFEFSFRSNLQTWQDFHNQAGKAYVIHVLKKADGNVSEAARMLCLERAYLHRLMKKLGVQRDVTVG